MTPRIVTFSVSQHVHLVADAYGTEGGSPVIFAHGGGQTRHAWGNTAESLALRGWYAVSVDQRGHGESDWDPGGDYKLETFANDLLAVADTFDTAPAVVGASLGGLAGLVAQAQSGTSRARGLSALVLVDVTPSINRDGVERIRAFMRQDMLHGFASVQEAADAIADYLPHRPRPISNVGLQKNLRLGPDNRYRWHWDPQFMSGLSRPDGDKEHQRLIEAARTLRIPVLLVRGGASEVVTEDMAQEFLSIVPHARYVDIAGARHMVAGDENHIFGVAVTTFLEEVRGGSA